MTELSKEQTRLTDTVELYTKYKQILSGIEEARELVKDPELGEFAKEEYSVLESDKDGNLVAFGNDDVKDEGMHKSLFLGLGGVGILVVLVVAMLLRKKK